MGASDKQAVGRGGIGGGEPRPEAASAQQISYVAPSVLCRVILDNPLAPLGERVASEASRVRESSPSAVTLAHLMAAPAGLRRCGDRLRSAFVRPRMAYRTLLIEYADDLAAITFNRPDKRNAISPEMIQELLVALDEVEESLTRVLILTGAGKAFCAGMDLEALKALAEQSAHSLLESRGPQDALAHSSEAHLADSRRTANMFRRIYSFPKPVVAAVNGAAIAGGCGIATLCDYTLAVPDAKFGFSEVRIGFVPALVSVFLVRQIGEKRARDLLLSGRLFDAEEARQMGLVNEVVPEEKLMTRARELATSLVEVSPTSLRHTKHLLADLTQKELDRELETAIHANAHIRSTADFREGLAAFLEKRKPHWRGQ